MKKIGKLKKMMFEYQLFQFLCRGPAARLPHCLSGGAVTSEQPAHSTVRPAHVPAHHPKLTQHAQRQDPDESDQPPVTGPAQAGRGKEEAGSHRRLRGQRRQH